MAKLFWLSDKQWAALEPLIPMQRRRVRPKRNREVIGGIIHVLHIGCQWEDCPSEYGPHTTIYNRFNRWSKAGIWQTILAGLVTFDAADVQCIDSTTAKAHRCAAGGKGGPGNRRSDEAGAGGPRKSTPSSMTVDASSLILVWSLGPFWTDDGPRVSCAVRSSSRPPRDHEPCHRRRHSEKA